MTSIVPNAVYADMLDRARSWVEREREIQTLAVLTGLPHGLVAAQWFGGHGGEQDGQARAILAGGSCREALEQSGHWVAVWHAIYRAVRDGIRQQEKAGRFPLRSPYRFPRRAYSR